jgi:catechol 2,3-dioxygenase-like lactoylglutathione lyase family enzyme
VKSKIDSHIVFLATRDLPTTAEFYEKTLGLALALDQGKCKIYQVAQAAFLGFCAKDEVTARDGVIVTLVTPDVDEWYEQLRVEGVKFEKAPAYNPEYRIYHCFFRDPNGYLVEIQRFEDPRWHKNIQL